VVLGIIPRFLLGVSQSRQQARCCLPGDLALRIPVPHGITGFFKFTEDVVQQLEFGIVVFPPSAIYSHSIQNFSIFDIRGLMRGSGLSVG
jgi:hypothetical protein